MVSQVGLNTGIYNSPYSFNNNMAFQNNSTNNSTNSLFTNNSTGNNGLYNPVGNDYSDDIMMQKFDTMLNSALNTQAQNPSQNLSANYNPMSDMNTNTSFTSNASTNQTADTQQPIDTSELNGYLAQQDKNIAYTENNNAYHKSNTAKKAGAVLGFLAPTAGKFIQLFKGGKFKDLFKFKQLAIACPALALAGLAIGSLVDGYINSNRAKTADQTAVMANQKSLQMQPYIA